RRAAHAGDARDARRALRAQRVHAGRDLAHRLLRPVGRRAREAARAADHPRARERGGAAAPARQLDERAHPPPSPATHGGVMTDRQAARLRHLSEYLHRTGRKFMFELLVPAEQAELEELHGDKRAYDRSRRPRHMVDAIHELQDAGVEPDVWKIEGLDRTEDCVAVVAAARRAGRAGVGCIVLGRGEDEAKVESWLSTAARVPGFIGFAVGRTTFWDALVGWRDGRTTREAASAEDERRYTRWCQLFSQRAADR